VPFRIKITVVSIEDFAVPDTKVIYAAVRFEEKKGISLLNNISFPMMNTLNLFK
jgi:hypothetical protein